MENATRISTAGRLQHMSLLFFQITFLTLSTGGWKGKKSSTHNTLNFNIIIEFLQCESKKH